MPARVKSKCRLAHVINDFLCKPQSHKTEAGINAFCNQESTLSFTMVLDYVLHCHVRFFTQVASKSRNVRCAMQAPGPCDDTSRSRISPLDQSLEATGHMLLTDLQEHLLVPWRLLDRMYACQDSSTTKLCYFKQTLIAHKAFHWTHNEKKLETVQWCIWMHYPNTTKHCKGHFKKTNYMGYGKPSYLKCGW